MSNVPLFDDNDRPRKTKTSIVLDEDVLEYFRATGRGFQGRINKALRWYIEQAEAEKARRAEEIQSKK